MLENYVRQQAEAKGLAIMGHLVCGYPSFEDNYQALKVMDEQGVDVVEMQFPFSEPIADGPLFLKANQESLEGGTRTEDCFRLMEKASQEFKFKILMMGYYNTVFKYGMEAFCRKLAAAGASGLIIPDLPLEESLDLLFACKEFGLDLIPLVAPTNSEGRLKQILEDAKGFVYAVARKGVTGHKTQFGSDLPEYFKSIRKYTHLPLAVGFGVSTSEDLKFLEGKAEMAVIGTAAMVAYLEGGPEGLRRFFQTLKNPIPLP